MDGSKSDLVECLTELLSGPWRFVQLRGEPLSALFTKSENIDTPNSHSIDSNDSIEESENGSVADTIINGDDIDLLGTRESVDQLLEASQRWVKEGLCHVRVFAARPGKVELTLFSRDGRNRAVFDLWIELPQIDRGRRVLRFDDCESLFENSSGSILRFPIEVEACVYLHHLICKRKKLEDDRVQRRLASLSRACQSLSEKVAEPLEVTGEGHAPFRIRNGYDDLATMLDQVRTDKRIAAKVESESLRRLQETIRLPVNKNTVGSVFKRLAEAWLAAPRKPSLISVMGCDGAGKTTLIESLSEESPKQFRSLTGKHLYRKSIVYKLAVVFVRPLVTRCRERFDEILAPVLYVRAAASLRWKTLLGTRRVTLMDRSLMDFLYVNRKTDSPSFCRSVWLSSLFGRRIPVIHCHVAFENVARRKQEITRRGHAAYDRDMFSYFVRQVPVDYVAFNNDGSLEEAKPALRSIIGHVSNRLMTVPLSESVPEESSLTQLPFRTDSPSDNGTAKRGDSSTIDGESSLDSRRGPEGGVPNAAA
ncbi:MAG: hypothetical protein FJ267_01080 [Planctomycetes bacterium]|nr:hypothetical protein [Planctomycetota bacterium]